MKDNQALAACGDARCQGCYELTPGRFIHPPRAGLPVRVKAQRLSAEDLKAWKALGVTAPRAAGPWARSGLSPAAAELMAELEEDNRAPTAEYEAPEPEPIPGIPW